MIRKKVVPQEPPDDVNQPFLWRQHFDHVDVRQLKANSAFVSKIPIAYARRHLIMGFDHAQQPGDQMASSADVIVACGRDESLPCVEVVARFLRSSVCVVIAPPEHIEAAIDNGYENRSAETERLIATLDRAHVITGVDLREDLLEDVGKAPVIQLVNKLLFEAVQSRASDIHLQPQEGKLVVRMRIDGILFDAFHIPKDVQEEAVSRIKVLGKMDIAEKRLPQDGRTTVQVGKRLIDLRISSLPTNHGERIVVRLLDKSSRLYTLGELGMRNEMLEQFQQIIRLEHGLVLVTGPTGSGKSTTLYAALQELNTKDANVVTLEDPIEYQLEGISQTQIHGKKGMTFASGLRTVLRQDPDIIMVGEIRDAETAVMAIQSAMTGHLVFSTLHTNDAASAVARLLDLGIEPYLVSSTLVGVLAQRLIRRNCVACQESLELTDKLRERFEFDSVDVTTVRLQKGIGCSACRQTGFQGRIGIFELLTVDDELRFQIQSRASASDIRKTAVAGGMRLLRADGLERVLEGSTTFDEVARVTVRSAM